MRLFVLAFVAGTLVLQRETSLPEWNAALAGIAAILAVLVVPRERRGLRAFALLASGIAAGYGLAAWRAERALAEALPRSWEGRDIEITGLVSGLPQPVPGATRFLFEVESVATPGAAVPRTISLAWYAQRAKDMPDIAPPKIIPGERWRLAVRLKRPRGLSNPHAFDFEAWALERGIRATGYVRAKPEAERVGERVEGWPYTLHRWRGEIRERMRSHLGEARLAGVLVALAIGDQDAIAAEDWQVFWRTGVGHLMSISGLHITMLAGLGFALAYFVWVRVAWLALRFPARKAAAIAGVLTALAYTLMTGYAVPAQRTFIMLSCVALCVLVERHGSASRVLALAVLAVLVADPWAVLSPGFWLSFGAVAAIFYAMALRTGRPGHLGSAALEQLTVTLAMLPMLIALFQEVSLVSPVANAFAIPLVSLVVVPLTLAGAFVAPLDFPLDAAHALMLLVMTPLEWLASWPSAMLESHEPRAWTIAAAILGVLWLLAPRGVPLRSFGFAWMAPMFLIMPPLPPPGEAWIDVLDVGHGLAVVVRTAHHALLYDAGPSWSGDSDSGARIVVPFLRGEGVPRLDGLVISHADDDHSGGAASVIRARDPAWLLSPLAPEHELHGLVDASIPCAAGRRWNWDGVAFATLHPPLSMESEARPRKENDRGCVVRVATAGGAMLLAADVEARAEAEMVARDALDLRSDVLLVPHHGSKTSSTPAFLDAVAPRFAIISLGYRNRFHHPHPSVVARYVARSIPLRRTDEEGAIRVVLPGPGGTLHIGGYGRPMRYWSEHRSSGTYPELVP